MTGTLVYMVLCDDSGKPVDLGKWPKNVKNHFYVPLGREVPPIGEKLQVLVDVEPGGENKGDVTFIIRDKRNYVFQTTWNGASHEQASNLSGDLELKSGGRVEMYVSLVPRG